MTTSSNYRRGKSWEQCCRMLRSECFLTSDSLYAQPGRGVVGSDTLCHDMISDLGWKGVVSTQFNTTGAAICSTLCLISDFWVQQCALRCCTKTHKHVHCAVVHHMTHRYPGVVDCTLATPSLSSTETTKRRALS